MKATVNNMKRCEAAGVRAIAYCTDCGAEFSATSGDYFTLRPVDALICCDKPMTLVRHAARYVQIRLPAA